MSQRLRESIEGLAREDRRFPADAYFLVFEGLEHALSRLPSRRHVAPAELLAGIHSAAASQWGGLADLVLDGWNVRSTRDLAELVFRLVDRNLLVASDTDTRAEFLSAGDLRSGLREAFDRELDAEPPRLARSR